MGGSLFLLREFQNFSLLEEFYPIPMGLKPFQKKPFWVEFRFEIPSFGGNLFSQGAFLPFFLRQGLVPLWGTKFPPPLGFPFLNFFSPGHLFSPYPGGKIFAAFFWLLNLLFSEDTGGDLFASFCPVFPLLSLLKFLAPVGPPGFFFFKPPTWGGNTPMSLGEIFRVWGPQ